MLSLLHCFVYALSYQHTQASILAYVVVQLIHLVTFSNGRITGYLACEVNLKCMPVRVDLCASTIEMEMQLCFNILASIAREWNLEL